MAPDASSGKSGRELANPAKWISKGAGDAAIWGECKGSGSQPYRAQIDRANIAFRCSCPSRKFPCKHGLGLMLLYARQPDSFADTNQPVWVTEWLEKRAVRDERKSEKKDRPVDAAAQAKRLQARERGVEEGMEELLLWMKDIVRNGILTVPEKGPSFFAGMARRMVDAKAPGLAGMVKGLGEVNFYKEGWQGRFMDRLADMYLVIEGFRNKEALPEMLKYDLLGAIGFTQNQEELKLQDGITDHWLVLGRQTIEEERLTAERNWLYGTQTNQYALVLQFGVRGQGEAFSFTPGMMLEAELVFYPSERPYRAVVKRQLSTGGHAAVAGFVNWQQVAKAETDLSAVLPFRAERPYILKQLQPVLHADKWWLADSDNRLMQLEEGFKNMYTLLAVTGGGALDMAVLGREHSYEPLGVWTENSYICLT